MDLEQEREVMFIDPYVVVIMASSLVAIESVAEILIHRGHR